MSRPLQPRRDVRDVQNARDARDDRRATPASPASVRAGAPVSDDSASFGGLADVLEPDPDAITSMRRLGAATTAGGRVRTGPPSLRGGAAAPASVRAPAPIQLHDFAFADTVIAQEILEDELPPPSSPIYVSDSMGNTQCVTPLAFRLPDAGADVDLATRLRVLLAHLRHAVRGAFQEMSDLWDGTAEMVDGGASGSRFARVLALWSCFQWSRADLTRAAMIGLAVFVTTATLAATTLDFGDASSTSNAAASAGVRGGRTLDQHTGRKTVVHGKR